MKAWIGAALAAIWFPVLLAAPPVVAAAGEAAPPAASSAAPAADTEQLAAIKASLAAAQDAYRQGIAVQVPPTGATAEELLERNHLLGELVANLEYARDGALRLPDLLQRQAEQQARARDWTAFPTPPPYSILFIDQLRDSLSASTFALQAANSRIELLDRKQGEDEAAYKAAEIAKRQEDEAAARAQTPEQKVRAVWRRDLAALKAKAAAAGLEEGRQLRAVAAAEAARQKAAIDLLQRQLGVAKQAARLPQEDLDAVLADLDRQQEALEKRLAAARQAGLQSRQALVQAQQALNTFKAAAPLSAEDGQRRQDLLERTVELRRLQADNDELAIDMTRRVMDVHAWRRTGWQYRWLLFNSKDSGKLGETLQSVGQLVARLQDWSRYIDGEIQRTPSGEAGDDRAAGEQSKEQAAIAAQMRTAFRARVEIFRDTQQSVNSLLRMLSVWRQDFLERGAERSGADILRESWAEAVEAVKAAWAFELFSIEEAVEIDGRKVVAARSVTLGKTLNALFLILIGYVLSGHLARRVGLFAVARLGAATGHASMIARWLHVSMLVLLLIAALYMVNIPLTVFAFLGGALAIGLGFGTQVLLKNLVSGVMLLIERPIKVGDLVEVGAIVGSVASIGIRSSTVRTGDGIEILVPNSTFIESNVTNWTYSSAKVRRSVKVGVDYAAPPTAVRDLLQGVVARHGHVLADPPPRVLLDEFAAEGLAFVVQYWIDYSRGTDAALVASDLRFMIESALDEAGIGILAPKRPVRTAP